MKIATLRYRNRFGTLLDETQVEYLSNSFDNLIEAGYTLFGVECKGDKWSVQSLTHTFAVMGVKYVIAYECLTVSTVQKGTKQCQNHYRKQ